MTVSMVTLLMGLAVGQAEVTSKWPGFLGQGATPLTAEQVPLVWSPETGIAWHTELDGLGQSSPVVWGGFVYLTTVDGVNKERLIVTSMSLKDGSVRWRHKAVSTNPEPSSLYISRAAPTPVVDEAGVYAYFEGGDVVAVAHDSQLLWTRSLTKEYGKPKNKFGLSASPVQTDQSVIVLVDDEGPSYLVALDKQTGKTLWKTDRGSRVSWSSPGLITIDGRPVVVCSSAGSVDGYDPQTGMQMWSYKDVGGNTATTPVAAGPNAFLVSASAGREGENAAGARKSNGLFRIGTSEGMPLPEFAWRTTEATVSWASPVVLDQHAYWVNRAGVVYCFDLATGEKRYASRIKQAPWATPLAVGNRLYLFGKDGLTSVNQSGTEFKVLAENALWGTEQVPVDKNPTAAEETEERRRAAAMFSGTTVYGVAAIPGTILIRTGSHLYAVR